jgi:hypothetical protein
MNRILVYTFIILILIVLINTLKKKYKENYDDKNRPPGPWGNIGTGKPWYSYPYILHNIEYY